MAKQRKTHKKFQRLPVGKRPGIKLQPFDDEMMMNIYRHRLVESDALYGLFPNRSKQMISRRLHKLYHNEYIDRPLAQRGGNETTPGSAYLSYAIDNLGAERVQKQLPFDIAPRRWRQKNKELTPVGADHFLDTTKYVAGLAGAVHRYDDTQLRYIDELIPSDIAAKRPPGLFTTLRADVPWHIDGENEGTACDGIVGLSRKDEGHILFVEIDRGTETIEPGLRKQRSKKFWRDTSYLRKFLIYAAAFRAKAHQTQLGLPVMQVLTVTTKPGRVGEMQECFARHFTDGPLRVPPGLFLFTDWQSLAAADDFLCAPYVTAAGKSFSLLPN